MRGSVDFGATVRLALSTFALLSPACAAFIDVTVNVVGLKGTITVKGLPVPDGSFVHF
jgi:hypothetical protein